MSTSPLLPIAGEKSIQGHQLNEGSAPGMPALRITGNAATAMQKREVSLFPSQRILSLPDPKQKTFRRPIDIPESVELVTVRLDLDENLIVEFVPAPGRYGYMIDASGDCTELRRGKSSLEPREPFGP